MQRLQELYYNERQFINIYSQSFIYPLGIKLRLPPPTLPPQRKQSSGWGEMTVMTLCVKLINKG